VRCAVSTRAVILCSGSKSKPQRLASRRSSSAVEATKLGLPCRAAQVHGRLLQGGCALSRIALSLSFFLLTAVFVANRFFVVHVCLSASRAGTAFHQSAGPSVRSAANGFFRFIRMSLRGRSRNWTRAGFAVALCRYTSRLRLSVLLRIGCARDGSPLEVRGVLPAADFLGEGLGGAMTKLRGAAMATRDDSWLVVPVPLHSSKLRHRGFSQAELVAGAAVRTDGWRHLRRETKALVRYRETASQAGLTRHHAGKTFEAPFECGSRS
jgi:hypothetical protein